MKSKDNLPYKRISIVSIKMVREASVLYYIRKIGSPEDGVELGKKFLDQDLEIFKTADMRTGKVNDDGYRGMHLYYQNSNKHYTIEIQVNTKSDKMINDWLHIHLYKHIKDNNIGKLLREKYDNGKIKDEEEFKEVLEHVLSNSKEI